MTRMNDSDDISDNLYRRDKSVSYSTGLELSPRPKTCLGVGLNHSKVIKLKEKLSGISDDRISSKTVKFHDDLVTDNSDHKNHHSEESFIKENKERGRLDKSHSTPAYDFGESDDGDFPLMKEIIPESPTSSIDSPSIVVHSPEKVDQILGFKKSSHRIGGAMIHHHRDKTKLNNGDITEQTKSDIFGEKHIIKSSKDTQILETINIAFLEHRKKEESMNKKTSNGQSIFQTEFGEPYLKKVYQSEMSEQIETISNVLFEAYEQRKLESERSMEFTQPKPDVPPEPPPRPLSTQKPGYIPPKPYKPIQKEDIHVIPNKSHMPSINPLRSDISLPVNSGASTSEVKHDMPRTPLMPARSLQVLETDSKAPTSTGNKHDTSVNSLKNDSAKLSVSPGNSMVRGLLAAGKSKSLKKKNSILASK